MDKKDVFSYFLSLRQKNSDDEIYELFDNDNYQINNHEAAEGELNIYSSNFSSISL